MKSPTIRLSQITPALLLASILPLATAATLQKGAEPSTNPTPTNDAAGNDVASTLPPPQPLLPKLTEPKVSSAPPVDRATLSPGKIRLELCFKGLSEKNTWPTTHPVADEVHEAAAFGFFELPHLYVDTGVRADRPNPLFVRASAIVNIPAGRHRFLLRGRGASCLFVDGKPILTTPFPPPESDNRPVTVQNQFLDLGPTFRFAPPGNRESWCEVEIESGEHLVILETIIGGVRGKGHNRPELGETVAAFSPEGSYDWKILTPEKTEIPYTDAGWEKYREQTENELAASNAKHRAEARNQSSEYWARRRKHATEWLSSTKEEPVPALPPNTPSLNPIDHFIGAKIAAFASQLSEAKSGSIDFYTQIQPILEARCRDCHQGGKAKGGLRLDNLATLLKGAKSGEPVLVPSAPEKSGLFTRTKSTDPDEVMPPKGDRLTPKESALLETWIKEGAHWPEFPPLPTEYTALCSDLEFLRRVTLDTVGVVPTPAEIEAFQKDTNPNRRAKVVDRLLADPRSADHWMGYWQDVLAENPNILNPTLNNSGPFRWWIQESLLDQKPLDLMVTELIRMKGSERFGGPAGFGVASQNDVPMAAKGTIVSAAFLGVEMKCARCHDAPAHSYKQEQLFQLAAQLGAQPIKVPSTSSVPMDKLHSGGRKPLIEVTLKPDTLVQPTWPFSDFVKDNVADSVAEQPEDPRDRLASLITAPENERFAQVMVNRIWARLMGRGIVEPVADWERGTPTHPELLRWLGRELVRSGYQTTHITKLILNSHAYQRASIKARREVNPLYTTPIPRRLTAEQIVDSLFTATEKPFRTEEASLDIDGIRDLSTSISLGQPRKAWMLTSTSNERDRPSLSLPRIQAVTDVLSAFGWRGSRQDPSSIRDHAPNSLQPAVLSNGIMGTWLTTLTDDHGITALALKKQPLNQLLDSLFLKLLTRLPSDVERKTYTEVLAPGYEDRFSSPKPAATPVEPRRPAYYVSWSNHLDPDATIVRQKQEAEARKGDPVTPWLETSWRLRLEDVVWTLLNAPEFVFTP
ncbi:MAG: DUF1553 domain-containing protein [Verrucomicrobiota bacterium]